MAIDKTDVLCLTTLACSPVTRICLTGLGQVSRLASEVEVPQ